VITLQYDEAGFRTAMRLAPVALGRNMRRAISRSLQEMARDARRNAPKGHSTLTNSINVAMVDDFEGTAGPHVDYARMVEEETGAGGFPPQQSLLDWIKVKHIEPNDPQMSQEDLAFVIARSIAARGTEAQPYLQPAFDDNKARAEQRISDAIDQTLRDIVK
jgi:hypothetical protein